MKVKQRLPRRTCTIRCIYCRKPFKAARASAKYCSKSHRVLSSIYKLNDPQRHPDPCKLNDKPD